jgi:heat shock protein HslJ
MMRTLALPALALGLTACSGSGVPAVGPTPPAVSIPDGDGHMGATAVTSIHGAWQLVSLQKAGGPVTPAPAPDRFTADFRADGRLHVQADCNVCNSSYEAGPGSLEVDPVMACTRAYCLSAPLDTQYTALLGQVSRWSTEGDSLELSSEAGVLRFRR